MGCKYEDVAQENVKLTLHFFINKSLINSLFKATAAMTKPLTFYTDKGHSTSLL